MSWTRRLLSTLRGRLRRNAVADEIREELQFHVRMRQEEYGRQGLGEEDARRAAERQFGNVAVVQDRGYEIRGAGIVDLLVRDVRYAFRALRRTPTFSVVAIAVLALSIGAGTAIYSVVDAVLLRSLPFERPDRIVSVEGNGGKSAFLERTHAVTTQTYLDWRRLQTSFDAIAMDGTTSFRYRTAAGEPGDVQAERVTSEFFGILRVRPRLGRTFTRDDEVDGHGHQVIVSDRFWRQQLAGDPNAVGRTLELQEEPWTIVGVLPAGFEYPVQTPRSAEIFVPQTFRVADMTRGRGHNYNAIVIGRLRDGVTIAQADSDMRRIVSALDQQYPDWEPGRLVRVRELRDAIVGDTSRWMRLLLATVGCVLLIACANVMNLLLARATVRRREVAVRSALGASRWGLVRAAVVEGLMISSAAAVIGVVLAAVALAVLKGWLPPNVPRASGIALNTRVLLVEMAVAVMTGVIFGLASAWNGGASDLTVELKSSGRGVAGGRGDTLRHALVFVETTLALVLLAGAGLFGSSFASVMRVDLGFNYRQVIALRNVGIGFDFVGAERGPWVWRPQMTVQARSDLARRYFDEVSSVVARVPGVDSVALVSGGVPVQGDWSNLVADRSDGTAFPGGAVAVDRIQSSPNYLSLLQVPIVRGRALSAQDLGASADVAVVNQAAAQRMWPGEDPIGQRFLLDKRQRLVVGVAADTRHLGPEEPVRLQTYVPLGGEAPMPTTATLVMRTTRAPEAVLPAVKAAIWAFNPDQHLTQDVYTLEGYLNRLVAARRFNMSLMAIFGALGLAIAAIGIYGVLSYIVTQRTREIGIRMALGARPATVIATVSRRLGVVVCGGLAAGMLTAWALAGVVRTFLFQTEPTDPRILAGVIGVLMLAGAIAAVVPAWRAVSIDPLHALREE